MTHAQYVFVSYALTALSFSAALACGSGSTAAPASPN